MRLIDRTGTRYGRLLVVARAKNGTGNKSRWVCRCDCDPQTTIIVQGGNLHDGHTTSCGCMKGIGGDRDMHGATRTPEHRAWVGMKLRCSNPNTKGYSRYGGRGIQVCDRWRDSFSAFLADMGPRPSPRHSVERRNNDGNYEPDNCYWATDAEQTRNTRQNRNYTYNGRTMCLTDWARESGRPRSTLMQRLERGWTLEQAMFTPTA